jgi:site-specific recombinase XerD
MNVATGEPRLLDKLCGKVRLKGYSRSTERNYSHWAKRYILFHHKRHPSTMGAGEVEAFLTNLASRENASSATQNQALAALKFLYKHVLDQPLEPAVNALRAKKYDYIPTVLTIDEVQGSRYCQKD